MRDRDSNSARNLGFRITTDKFKMSGMQVWMKSHQIDSGALFTVLLMVTRASADPTLLASSAVCPTKVDVITAGEARMAAIAAGCEFECCVQRGVGSEFGGENDLI